MLSNHGSYVDSHLCFIYKMIARRIRDALFILGFGHFAGFVQARSVQAFHIEPLSG
jgi:hypothetical protein